MRPIKDVIAERSTNKDIPTVSAVFRDGRILETVYDPVARETQFVLWKDDRWLFERKVKIGEYRHLVPYSPHNNLIKNDVVLLPSKPEEYESEEDLLSGLQEFIHRYVDVSPLFEKITSYYVLLSWVYDGFNELPYLRVRGDYGSGKTRFLLTVGSLCYKPIFASGASTVSPLFRLLEVFRGTMIIDESDFRLSDEKAEVVKILNNGNVRGFPVLRSEVSHSGEYNPVAYHVFGPKIVASRGPFDDKALESRFITEELGQKRLRDDIPINLPPEYKQEALSLRNQLLLFRFRNLGKCRVLPDLVDRSLEPRLNQIFVPLLSIVFDSKAREELRSVAKQCQKELVAERGWDTEAQVLEVIRELLSTSDAPLSVKEITGRFIELYGDDYERKVTNKWIGWVLRRRLGLKAKRGAGGYNIAQAESADLNRLYEKYGLESTEAGTADVGGAHEN